VLAGAACVDRETQEFRIVANRKSLTEDIRNVRLKTAHRRREDGDRQFVAALARGLAILRCFRLGEVYLSNQELARRSGLAKPTVSRLTYTLTRMAFLTYSPAREEYALGPGVLVLGHTYLAAMKVREIARPMMQAVADAVQATVAMGEHDGLHMVVVEVCHGSPTYKLRVEVGERAPRNLTALGHANLASTPAESRAETVEAVCRHFAPENPAPLATELLQSLREYDKLGFVVSCGEWTPEMFAVGVPLVSADGNRVLSLSCSGPVHEMNRKKLLAEVGPRMVRLRDRIHKAVQGFF
jgi:DNA-binding IclR family transcriptional regulator